MPYLVRRQDVVEGFRLEIEPDLNPSASLADAVIQSMQLTPVDLLQPLVGESGLVPLQVQKRPRRGELAAKQAVSQQDSVSLQEVPQRVHLGTRR